MTLVSEKQTSEMLRRHVASWKLMSVGVSQDLQELGAFILFKEGSLYPSKIER